MKAVSKTLLAMAAVVTAFTGAAQAATVISHNFTNAGRTSNPQNGNPSSGATSITGLDADTGVVAVSNTWNGTTNDYVVATNNGSMAGTTGGPTFFDAITVAYNDSNVPTVTSAINGASLRVINIGAFYSISTYFPDQTLAAGDSLNASFKVKVTRSAPTAGAGTFRVGLFNSGDSTRLTANSTLANPSAFDDDVGYMVRYDTSATNVTPLTTNHKRGAQANQNVFGGTSSAIAGAVVDAGGVWVVNDVYDVTIGVARSLDGASVTLTSTFGDGVGVYDDASFSAVDSSSPYVTFDHLGIFFGSQFGGAGTST